MVGTSHMEKKSSFKPLIGLVVLLLFHLLILETVTVIVVTAHGHGGTGGEQPLSKIAIHKAISALHHSASIKAHPLVLGTNVTFF